MADWSDISDLWWLQPQRESGRALQGLALGARMREARTQEDWRAEQAQVLMDQRRAAMQTQEAKVRGIAAMSSYMADVAARNAWTDPAAKSGFYRLGAQFPQAIDDPTLQAMAKNFEMAEAREAQAKQHAQTTTITELTAADTYENIARQIESMGPLDEEMSMQVSNLRQRATLLRGKQLAPTETIESLPGGGFKITRGPAGAKDPNAPTTAVLTGLQQKAYNSEDAVKSGLSILPQINNETIGIGANIKSVVLDDVLANVDPRLANAERIETRMKLRIWGENAIAAMRKDSQINAAEEKRMGQAMSQLDNVTSAAKGKVQLAGFIKEFQEITRQANLRQGKPVPEVAWNEKEIQAAYSEGIKTGFKSGITKERAIELLTNLKAIDDARANK